MAPYCDDYCGIVVKGVIQGLSDDGKSQKEVPPKAAFVYHDGAVHGNQSKWMKHFTNSENRALPKDHKPLFITRTQSSIQDEKDRVAGALGSTSCVAMMHLVSAKPLAAPVIPRLFGTGDNRSNYYGPFTKPSLSSNMVLKVKHANKTLLFGSMMRPAGGSAPGAPDSSTDAPIKPTDIVPMSYHGLDLQEIEEVMESMNAKGGAIEMAAIDGIAALCCVIRKVVVVVATTGVATGAITRPGLLTCASNIL